MHRNKSRPSNLDLDIWSYTIAKIFFLCYWASRVLFSDYENIQLNLYPRPLAYLLSMAQSKP